MTISGWPYSTGAPSSTRICVTLPDARRDDLVEGLHRLDQHQLVAGLHRRADLDERLGLGGRPQIGGADHRRFDRAGILGRRGRLRGERVWRGRRNRRGDRDRRRGDDMGRRDHAGARGRRECACPRARLPLRSGRWRRRSWPGRRRRQGRNRRPRTRRRVCPTASSSTPADALPRDAIVRMRSTGGTYSPPGSPNKARRRRGWGKRSTKRNGPAR